MSNANPTLAEIGEVVGNINNAYSDKLFSIYHSLDLIELFTIHSDGYTTNVACLGVNVFNTEDDPRESLYSSEITQIYAVNNDEAKEDLYSFLMTEYRKIKELLVNF
jgi:hypothetical protein